MIFSAAAISLIVGLFELQRHVAGNGVTKELKLFYGNGTKSFKVPVGSSMVLTSPVTPTEIFLSSIFVST